MLVGIGPHRQKKVHRRLCASGDVRIPNVARQHTVATSTTLNELSTGGCLFVTDAFAFSEGCDDGPLLSVSILVKCKNRTD